MNQEIKDNGYLMDITALIGELEYFCDNKDKLSEIGKAWQYAVSKCLELLGEAVKKLSNDIRESNPQIDWKGIIALRNKLIHEYDEICFVKIDELIEVNLPVLKEGIKKIYEYKT